MSFQLPQSVTMQQVLVLLLSLLACCSGCFIRNCPLGGKRAMNNMIDVSPERECLRCGPELSGQCLGPSICCGPMGCYMGTAETRMCQKENDIPTPCRVEGDSCGGDARGKCVADGLCCSEGGCDLDNQCEMTEIFEQTPRDSGSLSPELMTYIRQLVAKRAYGRRR